MNYPSEFDAKAMICEYGKRLYAMQFVAGNEGNISCRTEENEVWITPTMESKGYLTPDMLVKLDMDGNVLSSPYLPSSESKMHIGLYKENPSITGVVHAHPPFASAFACCGENTIPSFMMPEPTIQFGKEIPIARYATPGTIEVPDSVKPYANKHRAILLANHGALTWAPTLKDAMFTMEKLESHCKTYLIASKFIGNHQMLSDKDTEVLLDMHDKLFV